LAELSNWVQDLFNYRIEIKSSEGHLSINLLEGSYSTNIVDTGYGVSQILPVLGQIWWAARRPRLSDNRLRRRERLSILAIEQPELHLHPAHQALLADAISAQSKTDSSGEPLHFVVETHSETFVNRLGELIADKKLDPENVQILVFDSRDEDARVTTVEIARFGTSGELINWPYGFFQAAQI
jgi:predicted ATPase